jgi:uncharacterized Ntn-hydrolase superfamily protein
LLRRIGRGAARGRRHPRQQSAGRSSSSRPSSGRPWEDRKVDLRVEDHADPIGELRRCLQLQRAYAHMNAGDLAMEKKRCRCGLA